MYEAVEKYLIMSGKNAGVVGQGVPPKVVTPAQAGAQGIKQDFATGKSRAVGISRMLPWAPACLGGDKGGMLTWPTT